MGSTSNPIRLAILEADTPLPNTNTKYHGYRGVFTDLFRRAVAPDPVERHLAITGYDVVNHPETYPDLDSIDAVLISGSKHSAYLDEPWILKLVEFAQAALATDGRVKVVGVCFGHQIVGRALGTKVGVNEKGWEISVTDLKLSEKGKGLFGSDTLVSIIRMLGQFPALIANARYIRKSTKCTGISSSPRLQVQWNLRRRTCVRARASSCPGRPSQYKATRNLLARSCPRFWA